MLLAVAEFNQHVSVLAPDTFPISGPPDSLAGLALQRWARVPVPVVCVFHHCAGCLYVKDPLKNSMFLMTPVWQYFTQAFLNKESVR